MSLLTRGIRRLSELEIDANKDWDGMGITNLKQVAAAMIRGDLAVRGNSILDRLSAGPVGYVLTSTGVGNKPSWAPGSGPGVLYFPVWIGLDDPTADIVAPDHTRDLDAPVVSVLDPTTVATETPVVDLSVAAALFTPDYSKAESAPVESCSHEEVRTTIILGHEGVGGSSASIADMIRGSRFMCMQSGNIGSIDVYLQVTDNGGGVPVPVKVAIYDVRGSHAQFLRGSNAVNIAAGAAAWHNFPLTANQAVTIKTEYWVVAWADDIVDMAVVAFFDSGPGCDIAIDQGLYLAETFAGFPPLTGHTREQTKFSIYGNYV